MVVKSGILLSFYMDYDDEIPLYLEDLIRLYLLTNVFFNTIFFMLSWIIFYFVLC